MFIYPYKKGSKSAKALGKALGVKVLTRPKFKRKGPKINWGNNIFTSRIPTHDMINNPRAVAIASNKLLSFLNFKRDDIPCPDFTERQEIAAQWLGEGYTVMCRTLLRSHSGKGIVIAKKVNELVAAPLYVKYFPKSHEFRIHVFNGKVIDYVQKKKRNNITDDIYNKYIRSHANGWVFCRDNIIVREGLKTLAVNAVKALGLDFGAVDIITTTKGTAKVLEVNTAPALEGTTLERYTNAIKEYVDEII